MVDRDRQRAGGARSILRFPGHRGDGRRPLHIIGCYNSRGSGFPFEVFLMVFKFAQEGIKGVLILAVADHVGDTAVFRTEAV